MNIQAPRPPMGPLIEALKALLGDRLSVSAAVREQHGHDESYHATAAARRRRLRPLDGGGRGDRQACAPSTGRR